MPTSYPPLAARQSFYAQHHPEILTLSGFALSLYISLTIPGKLAPAMVFGVVMVMLWLTLLVRSPLPAGLTRAPTVSVGQVDQLCAHAKLGHVHVYTSPFLDETEYYGEDRDEPHQLKSFAFAVHMTRRGVSVLLGEGLGDLSGAPLVHIARRLSELSTWVRWYRLAWLGLTGGVILAEGALLTGVPLGILAVSTLLSAGTAYQGLARLAVLYTDSHAAYLMGAQGRVIMAEHLTVEDPEPEPTVLQRIWEPKPATYYRISRLVGSMNAAQRASYQARVERFYGA
jgi:hypothetical protein